MPEAKLGFMNQVILLGFVGKNARTFEMDNGGLMVIFDMATRDELIGKNAVEWHTVKVFDPRLVSYASKIEAGARVLVIGRLRRSMNKALGKASKNVMVLAEKLITLGLTPDQHNRAYDESGANVAKREHDGTLPRQLKKARNQARSFYDVRDVLRSDVNEVLPDGTSVPIDDSPASREASIFAINTGLVVSEWDKELCAPSEFAVDADTNDDADVATGAEQKREWPKKPPKASKGKDKGKAKAKATGGKGKNPAVKGKGKVKAGAVAG